MSDEKRVHAESMFIDSGAHSLYNIEVLKHGAEHRRPKSTVFRKGGLLDKPKVVWGGGDFSFYDLSPGTEFRQYCDAYGVFMQKMQGRDVLLANVDAISNPKKTWEIQKFFEEEYGVLPVPIVHYGTPMKWVARYVEDGRYPLLGVGGLGQGVSRHQYFRWADVFFDLLCPRPSSMPVIRTHGFAMTSHELMVRYPWWSVDSATWVKLSAYGWIYIPRWSKELGDWNFNEPPMMINFSVRAPKLKKGVKHVGDRGQHFDIDPSAPSPRASEFQKHYLNMPKPVQRQISQWLEGLGMVMGSLDKDGDMEEFGVTSHHRARSIANLHYLKRLEASRPKWPHSYDRGHAEINIKNPHLTVMERLEGSSQRDRRLSAEVPVVTKDLRSFRIYFSGGGGLIDTPEVLVPELKPHIMLTYHLLHEKQAGTKIRLLKYLKRKREENADRT